MQYEKNVPTKCLRCCCAVKTVHKYTNTNPNPFVLNIISSVLLLPHVYVRGYLLVDMHKRLIGGQCKQFGNSLLLSLSFVQQRSHKNKSIGVQYNQLGNSFIAAACLCSRIFVSRYAQKTHCRILFFLTNTIETTSRTNAGIEL